MAYAVVGLGAAAYSPAKYGILTELLPASQLVKANGWIEGLTIASIILGILLGGQLVGHAISSHLLAIDFPFIDTGIDTPPEAAIFVLIFVYTLAAWFNTRIPLTGVEMRPMPKNPLELVPDFWTCNSRLWRDKLGQISLATTTLFWGVSGNLRYIILAWSVAALGYSTTQASSLDGRGGDRHRGRRDRRLGAHAAGHGHAGDPDGHRHGRAGHRDELHRQRLGGRALPDPDGRAGRLPGGADERAAAAPRPQPDGRRAARSRCRTSTSRPASWAWARSTACPPAWACRPSEPSPRSGWWWPASCG